MKRFRFALERVLRLKRQKEKQAELRTALARATADAARTQVATLGEMMERTAVAAASGVGSAMHVDMWFAHQQHAARIGHAIEHAEQEQQHAEHRLKEADLARARIATEVETLVHLRSQRWDEHRHDASRTEQQRNDETVLHRWWRRQRNETYSGRVREEAKRS
jgi:flagellar export protein FliJ